MKISYNWLKEFVDFKVTPQKLADDLSLFGHEVESIKKVGNDYILDFEITPNRGDCLSIFGIAREAAALYSSKFNVQSSKLQFKIQKLNKKIDIKIENPIICPRYTAVVVDDIKINESPKLIKDRLLSLGIRPINNIVDATNYVMLELGQPMHAFDYDKISNGIFNVRCAKPGESVMTLDGINRKLGKDAIVIEDKKKIYDLAGIMGGFNSEISKNTKTIVLEAAIFDPVLIRRTSKLLKLQTEASYRYERGVDAAVTIPAIIRAIEIIKGTCPNIKIGTIQDQCSIEDFHGKLKINVDKINHLLGTKFDQDKIKSLLGKLGFQYSNDSVVVPSYRKNDVKIWQDVAEELARIYGYNKLGELEISKSKYNPNTGFINKGNIKDILAKSGFTEVYSYSFADKKLLMMLGYNLSNLRKVINGLTPETEYLRPDLVSSLLTTFAKNPWAPEIKIFEIGKVFDKNGERWQLGIAISSKNDDEIDKVLRDLDIKPNIIKIDQKVLDHLKIRKKISIAIVDLKEIKNIDKKYSENFPSIRYQNVSEFSPTIRDLAFIVDESIDSEKVKDEIIKSDPHILITEFFDEFASDKFGKNKKNIAFHVWMQNINSAMDEQEVKKITNLLIKRIENKFNAKLRT